MTEMGKGLDLGREIIAAIQEVFSTMLMLDVAGEDVSGIGRKAVQSNVTSMIGLGGDLRGIVALHCPAAVARNITGSLLGMEVIELDEDVRDAMGEIVNMVAGSLKTAFAGVGVNVELAIPTSVIGESFRISGIAGATRHCISFQLGSDTFWVELLHALS